MLWKTSILANYSLQATAPSLRSVAAAELRAVSQRLSAVEMYNGSEKEKKRCSANGAWREDVGEKIKGGKR